MKAETAITPEQAASQLEFIFATAIAKGHPESVHAGKGKILTLTEAKDRYSLKWCRIALHRIVAFFHLLFLLLLVIPRVCDWCYSLWRARKPLLAHRPSAILKVIFLNDRSHFQIQQSWLSIRVWRLGKWCDRSEIKDRFKKAQHTYDLARQTIRRYNAGSLVILPKLVELGVPVTGDILAKATELTLVEKARKVLEAKKDHSSMPLYLETIESPLIEQMNDVISFCFTCGIKLQEDSEGAGGKKLERGSPSTRNYYFKQAASSAQ